MNPKNETKPRRRLCANCDHCSLLGRWCLLLNIPADLDLNCQYHQFITP